MKPNTTVPVGFVICESGGRPLVSLQCKQVSFLHQNIQQNAHQVTVSACPTVHTVEASGLMIGGLITSLLSSGIARTATRKKRHKVVNMNIMNKVPVEPEVDELLRGRQTKASESTYCQETPFYTSANRRIG